MRGGCSSVSMVRATAGLCRRAGIFAAFLAVHMTIADPFHANPIAKCVGNQVGRRTNWGSRCSS